MAGSDRIIRPFTPADQVAARRPILDGLGEHFGSIDETRNPDIDDILASYVIPGHIFLVAQVGGVLVGTAALIVQDARTGRVVRVSVSRGYRRRGIGRALVTRLVEAARARGLTRLWMETNDDWADAIGLYRRCGFREYKRTPGNVYMALEWSRNQIVADT
jgi:ribosomal protein S18 acetylase RimI-like enzyme